MKAVNPYLNFKGNTEEAFNFYKTVFGGEFRGLMRFRDFGDNSMGVPAHQLDKIAHIALPLGGGALLMATDVVDGMPGTFTVGTNFYITLEPDTAAEAKQLFAALSTGGSAEMPLQPTQWAEMYGICTDQFGVQWMVNFTGTVQSGPA
jgi:PhnB protein